MIRDGRYELTPEGQRVLGGEDSYVRGAKRPLASPSASSSGTLRLQAVYQWWRARLQLVLPFGLGAMAPPQSVSGVRRGELLSSLSQLLLSQVPEVFISPFRLPCLLPKLIGPGRDRFVNLSLHEPSPDLQSGGRARVPTCCSAPWTSLPAKARAFASAQRSTNSGWASSCRQYARRGPIELDT
jgi:hypothetical protein